MGLAVAPRSARPRVFFGACATQSFGRTPPGDATSPSDGFSFLPPASGLASTSGFAVASGFAGIAGLATGSGLASASGLAWTTGLGSAPGFAPGSGFAPGFGLAALSWPASALTAGTPALVTVTSAPPSRANAASPEAGTALPWTVNEKPSGASLSASILVRSVASVGCSSDSVTACFFPSIWQEIVIVPIEAPRMVIPI